MADGSRIPRVIIDPTALRSLRLTAADGFVLSRIDGRASERELSGLTGLPEHQIRTSLETLVGQKVIDFNAAAPPPPQSKPALPPARDKANSSPGLAPESDPKLADGAAAAPVAPAGGAINALAEAAIANVPDNAPELAEEVDIAIDVRRRILGLHSVIGSLDHYGILGLARTADKKAVKRSYFELSAFFHPDRYFRKSVGSFKPKMEVIFARVSTAYETLVDKTLRAEYDLYLGDVDKARDVEAMLRNVMSEVETAEKSAVAEAGSTPSMVPPGMGADSTPSLGGIKKYSSGSYAAVNARPITRPPIPPAPSSGPSLGPSLGQAGPGSNPSIPVATPSAPARSAVSDQLRREALAMRLKGSARPVTKPPIDIPPPPPPASAPKMTPAEGADLLKKRYEERVEAGRVHQGKKYLKIGEDAESRNDLTAAAAAYRVALTFLRAEDPTFAHAKEVIVRSETALGETYMRQGQHEEKAGRWEDAVRSWGRAAKLRPNDAVTLERYANALLQSKGDLHEAVQLAQRAVSLNPSVGEFRCTLVNVLVGANLQLNAKREIEAAAAQFPDNPSVQVLLKKLTAKPA